LTVGIYNHAISAKFFTLHRRIQRDFTLIELMVVPLIIGVLAALIVPNVLDRADDARFAATKSGIPNIHSSPDEPAVPVTHPH